jgi:hypothetical protein
MKRLKLILPAAVLLLSGCAVYEPGPVYPSGYYVPPPRVVYGYPTYAPPPVYGGVWFRSGGGYRGDHHGGHHGRRHGHWR